MSYESKPHYFQGRGSVSSEKGNTNNAAFLMKNESVWSSQDEETWAYSLVGRWWEIFWESSSPLEGKSYNVINDKECPGEVTQQSLQHNQQQCHLIQSNPLSHQQLSRDILFDVTYETAQLKLVLETCGGKLTVSNILEGAPNSHLIKAGDVIVGINGNPFPPIEQDKDCKAAISLVKETPRPMIVTFQRLQKYEAQHNITPALTSAATSASNSSHNHVPETKRLISSIEILQTHANTFLAKGVDEITIPIPELGEGWRMRVVARKKPHANHPCADRFIISPSGKLLRSIAELERFLKKSSTNVSNDSGSDDDDENIPLCVLAERQQKQQQHNEKHHCGKRNHTDDNSEDEEDAPDWYDAKIKSYNNGDFVVHFLGDEDDVTYTMPLKPSIVRPSTRAWGRRSLALLKFRDSWSCDRGRNSNQSNVHELIKISTFDSFSSWLKQVKESLPPSTDLPNDDLQENSLQDDWGDHNTNMSIGFRKIQEYRRLLEEQTKLCIRLSPPHNEDESCDDDDDETSDEKGPGPYADASYIDHLNRCLIATSEACEWLLKDSTLWDILKKVSMVLHNDTFSFRRTGVKSNLSEGEIAGATAPLLSKETLQGIVVAGAKALHQFLMSCDLSRRGSLLSKQSQKVRRTTKRNRRLELNHGTSYNGNISGEHFGTLFATAPSSQESMKILITGIIKISSDVQHRNFIQSSITSVLSFMYENVWKPLVNWIETAEDMDLRKSDKFFSFEEVDSHKRAAENMGHLRLIDLSPWTSKLENKLRRARHFEVEAWSAIKACIQLDGGTSGISTNPCQDQCLLLLRRLKKEAATIVDGDGATGNSSITNLNPLGGQSISPQGVPISSSLSRAVIDDAIVTRAWVVDFIHAKTVRERASFVEDVIRRYVTLPQLPALPSAFAGIGLHGVVSPSSVLAQNTKDSITILSANAYSYNHIIGNFASRLPNDFSLRTKSGISVALGELKKLPILSVIEEKLIIREELIDWNDEALQMIGVSATYKCPFSSIESLHTKLMNILHGKTECRERIIQNIRYDEAIEKEVISFVADDEGTICPISGPWVRTQYKMGNDWKSNSSSIIECLRCCGFFSKPSPATAGEFSTSVLVDPPLQQRRPPTPPTRHNYEEHSLCQTHQQMQQHLKQPRQQSAPTKVTLESISKLLEIHDGSELASSFPEDYKLLNNIKQNALEWSSSVKQIVSSESLSIAERGDKLVEILAQKPVGVEMHPTIDDIKLWCRVYRWLNNLDQGMDSLMDQLAMWKDGSLSSASRFGNSEREVLLGLTSAHMSSIIEGQEFLTPVSKNNIPGIVSELKDEILRDFDTVGKKYVQVISKKDILESKFPMDVMIGSDEDRKMAAPLFICQCLVWRLICDRFMSRIEEYLATKNRGLPSSKKPTLKDAKAILSFCPVTVESFFPLSDIIVLKVKKSFQQMVEDAEALQARASQTLDDCTNLLQTNCFLRKDDICRSLQLLKNIQVDLVRHENSAIGPLLNIYTKVGVSRKVTSVEWLVKCFSFPALFTENTAVISNLDTDPNKIPFCQLEKLRDSIPVEPGGQWNETCGVVDTEILRISHVVRNLFQSADMWQSAVSALLPFSSKGQEMILEEVRQRVLELTDLEEIVKNTVLSKVKMPQMKTVRNVITLAREIKARLENELLCIEFMSTDVNKSRFPDDKSLVGKNGDFLLYRLTGSEIYACLRERLRSISETATRLTVVTQEKLAFQWLVEVFQWVEEIEKAVTDYSSLDGYKRTRLFINFNSARRILMKGEDIFFNIEDVTKEILRAQKISIRLTPQRVAVVVLKGGVANSPGAHLLRWGALLYGCIKSDVDRADNWEHHASIAIETYKSFSLDGSISHLGNATRFRDNVENLIDEAVNDLTIQNEETFQILRDLREKIECSDLVKKQMKIEQVHIDEEEFQVEIDRYENPRNMAFARFELLDSILKRLHEDDSDSGTIFDSLHASSIVEQSGRDKSRLFLEKSLVKGMETFGIELSQVDARGFCSLFAMNLENAIFDKFKSTKETISNEYRDKIRSLRFNLQDPKNPLLCARVLSEDIKIPNLIAMSSDELASKEIKQMRQQVKEESIKNVVISPSSQVKDPVAVDWGSRDISIDEFSNSSKPAPLLSTGKETPRQSPSPVSNGKPPVHIPLPVLSSGVQSYESLSSGADGSSGSTNTEFVRKPPFESAEPPTRKNSSPTDYGSSSGRPPKKGSNSVAMTYSAPPALSPPEHEVEDFLTNLPSPIITPSTQNHGRHITSQSGTETFTITISRLKVSFTTKMFIERTCPWELNGFLPSDLVDKGRISIEEFNKFISEKMKSGKWTLIHLKLSSIVGESNKTSYKRFYKEYESIDRICMIPVSDDGTKIFLVTPKFLRIIKCMSSVENLSRTNTYVVVLTKRQLPQRYQSPVVRTKGIGNADSSVPMPPYGANL